MSIDFIKQIGIFGLIDILFMWILIYTVLVWFKRTKATFILTGIIMIGLVYLMARVFNLVLTTFVLQAFFAVILVAIIVIFQEELRQLFAQVPERLRQFFEELSARFKRFFERLPIWKRNRDLEMEQSFSSSEHDVQTLARTLIDLAREKTGALVVLPGKELVIRYLDGGVNLNGELSEPLLKSIFDAHSIGHDGAVIVERGRISKFSCHLPLSKNFAMLHNRGTRHAAALGLAELTDALCLIVSEERGTISAARRSELRQIGSEQLVLVLDNFYREINPSNHSRPWYSFFTKNYKEKLVALVITIALWFVFVYGSRQFFKEFVIPIDDSVILSDHEITEIEPKQVKLTFSGPHNAFYFLNENEIRLSLKTPDTTKDGLQTIDITESDLYYPNSIRLEDIEPRAVKVRVQVNEQEKPE